MGGFEGDPTHYGIKSEAWRGGAAQNAGRWLREVEDGEEAYMRKSHDAERSDAAKRHPTAATATQTIDTNASRGGAGVYSCHWGGSVQKADDCVWPASS